MRRSSRRGAVITKRSLPNTSRGSCLCQIGATAFGAAVALALLMCAIDVAQAQNGNLLWAKRAGGLFDEQGNAVAVDSQGNSYVTGYFQDTGTFGPGEANQTQLVTAGSADIFIAKYNSDGMLVWAKKAGGASFDQGNGIAVDSLGNIYVVGAFVGMATFGAGELNQTQMTASGAGADIFVAKYNSDGTLAWAKQAGGTTGDSGHAIAVDSQGNSYITGLFLGTVTFGAGEPNQTQYTAVGSFDYFIAKYNGNGTLAWVKRIDGSGFSRGNGVAVDGQGNSYVAGVFSSVATFSPGEKSETALTSASGSIDVFVAKYNPDGTLVWAKRAGGALDDSGFAIAVDSSGSSYVTGLFSGTSTFGQGEANQTQLSSSSASEDIFIAKYNSDGTLVWAKRAGGISSDFGIAIAVDAQTGIYVTGQFTGTATFGQGEPNQTSLSSVTVNADVFVAKYNNDGTVAWARAVNGPNTTQGRGIAVDSQGNSYVTGVFNGTTTFGPGEANQTIIDSGGFSDIFVAKFAGGPILVNCPGSSLQTAVNSASPGSTILVSGTCSENLLIRNEKQRITIDGAGAGVGTRATINAPGGSPGFNVRGKGIVIQNFIITGGNHGVVVNRGSNAVLNNNVIQNTGGDGVKVEQLSFTVLINNLIENNPNDGVSVQDNSTARIGFNADSETVASSNTIQNNDGRGIKLGNGAHARIIGNLISGNGDEGIAVERDSSADIASNTINGNQSDGIKVESNSFIMLGEDSGTSIYETPNATTVNNQGVGVRCDDGSVVDGRQGTLTGNGGATDFDSSCVNSLI